MSEKQPRTGRAAPPRLRGCLGLLAATGLALGSCIDGSGGAAKLPTPAVPQADGGPSSDAAIAAGVTFYKDILPIVRDHCQGCHVQGGIGPFPLTTYDEVKAQIQRVVVATQSRIMPPWMPSDDCRPLQGSRRLEEGQIDAFAAWMQEGLAKGDPSDTPAGGSPAAAAPSTPPDLLVAMPERYLPNQTLTDDYRCFVIDPGLTDDVHVTGFYVEPGNKAIVHHVLIFLAGPEQVDEANMLDANEPGPGYTCFGGPGLTQTAAALQRSLIVGGWAPGAGAVTYPQGTGIRIEKGSRLIFQVHYNVPNAPNTDDLSQAGLYFAKADAPVRDAISFPFAPFDPATFTPSLHIAAGDPHAVVTAQYPMTRAFRMYGTAPHMHLRGKTINLSVRHADMSEDCLIDIPSWDFHWQGQYQFQQPIDIMPGDMLVQTCVYDNSAGNQPLGPDGQPVQPTDIHWGERTTDEMCLTFSYATDIPP